MNHVIKILEDFADAVVSGEKTFEIRENDRGYQKGDYVVFKTIPGHPIEQKVYKITYVINGWGLKNGYVAFGIKEVKGAVSGIIEDKGMRITVVEYGSTEHHINCKSFEFRTNQVENWIRIDGSKEIHGVATIKAGSEVEK